MTKHKGIQIIAGLLALGALALGTFFFGREPKPKPGVDYELMLRGANRVTIKEKTLSFAKKYYLLVDGEYAGTVTGKIANFFGDKFTLKTLDGKVLTSEQEEKRFFALDRAATVYDEEGKISGYIGEKTMKDLFSFSHIMHFYDENKQEIGKSKSLFLTLGDYELYDANGNTDYYIDKKFTFISDKYVLDVRDQESKIPKTSAILLACIEDAINDARDSKSNDDD